jgi:5-methylcytosine-specific restriction endonuclease McrA
MKKFVHHIRIGSWRLYLSNVRLKKMNPSGIKRGLKCYSEALAAMKKRHFKQSGGRCDECGRKMRWDDVQMHHVLPFSEFPQYGTNPANVEIMCEECHHAIHLNPYTNLRRMEKKAQEFGFNLTEYYSK